ncbi:MAG: hypothetical protein WDO69_28380 [Pseudomonadota bacterium]
MKSAIKLGCFLPLLVACTPEFPDRSSSVETPRVLGVQAMPAEAVPGASVSYRILVVDQNGTLDDPQVDWSYCTKSKPLNELNDVASECFGEGDFVEPFDSGSTAKGKLPKSGCSQFGPDIPKTLPGQSPGRPTDPDSSGGFYQPVILDVHAGDEDISSLAETRITCGLANGAGDIDAFRTATKTNENPAISTVTAVNLDNAVLSDGAVDGPLSVPVGMPVVFRTSWPSCPTDPVCGDGMCTSGETVTSCPDDCLSNPVGCTGSESYGYVDPTNGELVPRHEAMRVAWFATQGSFDDDHTGRTEDDFAMTSSDNAWQAPSTPGLVFMWVVLRDARGGSSWQSFQLRVE